MTKMTILVALSCPSGLGRKLGSGVYFAKLVVEKDAKVRKLVLTR